MATLTTNLVSCKLESLLSFGLWVRFLVYCGGIGFLVVDHMLPECLLFIFGTPLVRCNMWP